MAFNRKRADILASKFWIFFHFAASLTANKYGRNISLIQPENALRQSRLLIKGKEIQKFHRLLLFVYYNFLS